MIDAVTGFLGAYPLPLWIFAAVVVFAAGFLRGFTGFGFGLSAVPALTLFLEPQDIVPAVVIIAALVGLQLLRRVWSQADWPSVKLLTAGAVIGTPLGTWVLATVSADLMRAIIGTVCIAAVLLLWRGFKLHSVPGRGARLGIGALSGLINGATAMGGPPVIIFFLALPSGVAVGRASLLVFFFFTSLISIAVQSGAGLMSWRVVALTLLMMPVMALGNGLGDHWFGKATDRHYRQVALVFLLLIAIAAVARALVGLQS
jgi:uncharacterized membrane protein YfcA